jgi:hypothetical protein
MRGFVNIEKRNERLKQLVKTLNKQRKKQALQIDILCNDLINAQKTFVGRLRTILFTTLFYESIIPADDMEKLLSKASELIKKELPCTNVTFFLRNPTQDSSVKLSTWDESRETSRFEQYSFENNRFETFSRKQLQNYFKPELIENIAASNKVWTEQDISQNAEDRGQKAELLGQKNIRLCASMPFSIAAIPLKTQDLPLGLIILSRSSNNPLTKDQTDTIFAVTRGLSHAISSNLTQKTKERTSV